MPKLQRIKRANGSLVYSVNIPLEVIEELGWEKGNNLSLEVRSAGDDPIVIVLKQKDNLNEKEEEKNET